MNHVARNLRAQRNKRALSQTELAKKLDVTRQTISNWETGRACPDIGMIKAIALKLNTDVNSLICDQEKAPAEEKESVENLSASFKPFFLKLFIVWSLFMAAALAITVMIVRSTVYGDAEGSSCIICLSTLLNAGFTIICTGIILVHLHKR